MLLKYCIILHRVLEKRINACIYQLKCRILQSIYYRYNLFKHQLKGGSNNSEIGICALSEVYFWKFVREHSGLCDRTNFQKDTFESVQITFQNSRTLKTEFLEPPFTQYPRWESNSDHCFRRAVFYPLNYGCVWNLDVQKYKIYCLYPNNLGYLSIKIIFCSLI